MNDLKNKTFKCPQCHKKAVKKQTAIKDCGKGLHYQQCKNCGWELWSK
jgi:predicted RNA-binding Zn-ribbon protein involved in translation (DUF1610 family)